MKHYDLTSEAGIDNLIDDIDALTDQYIAVGLRGLYQDEVGCTDLQESTVWDDGEKTDEGLGGTSVVGIVPDWDYAERAEVIDGIAKALGLVAKYNRGHGIAIVIGKYSKDAITEDIGEYVLGDATIIGLVS